MAGRRSALRVAAARVNLTGWALVAALVVLWQVALVAGLIDLTYLPRPTEVVGALVEVAEDGTLLTDLGHTLSVAGLAAGLAVLIGVALGVLMAIVRPVSALTSATVDFLRSIPAVSLMPVVLLLLGATASSEVLVGVFAGVWPVLLNTIGGIQAINPRLQEVSRVLHLSRRDYLVKVLIPSAVPSILVGLRLSVVTSLVVVIIAEMLINPEGIGWALASAQSSLRPEVLFAYAWIVGVLGYLVNLLLVRGVRMCMPGSPALRSAA